MDIQNLRKKAGKAEVLNALREMVAFVEQADEQEEFAFLGAVSCIKGMRYKMVGDIGLNALTLAVARKQSDVLNACFDMSMADINPLLYNKKQ